MTERWLAPPVEATSSGASSLHSVQPSNFNTQLQGGLTRSSRQSSLSHLTHYNNRQQHDTDVNPDAMTMTTTAAAATTTTLSSSGSSSTGHRSPAPSVSPMSTKSNSGFVVTSRPKAYQPPPSPDARPSINLGPSPPLSQHNAAGPSSSSALAATSTYMTSNHERGHSNRSSASLSHTTSNGSRRGSASPPTTVDTGPPGRKPSQASSRSSGRAGGSERNSPTGEPKTTLHLSSSIDSRGRRMVNQYVRLKTIGQGSHGKVWLCAEPTLRESDWDQDQDDQNEVDDEEARRKGKRAQQRLQRWEEEIEAGNFRYCAIKSVARDGPRGGKSLRAARGRRQQAGGGVNANTTGISADNKIKREVAIMKRLDHPNIVRLKEVIDDVKSKKVFMVLEFMAGGQVVWQDDHRRPTLTVKEARRTFRDVVLGLEYLHYHGIIHRDIKPANLLWTEDHSVVKISDFGVSHVSEALLRASPLEHSDCPQMDDDNALRKTAGSPAFFAPELCHPTDYTPTPSHGQPDSSSTYFPTEATDQTNSDLQTLKLPPATMSNGIALTSTIISDPLPAPDASKPRTRPQIGRGIDVWALGVTLYCLLFGDTPFTANTEYELYNVIACESIRVPERMGREGAWTGVPTSNDWPERGDGVEGREVVNLLGRLLEKDPAKRISLAEVKKHPWVLRNLENPQAWLRETDPVKSQSVDITEEDVKQATQARGAVDSLPAIRNRPGIRRALNAALVRFPAFARIKSQRSSTAENESARSRSKSASSTSQHDHEPTPLLLSRTPTDEIQPREGGASFRKRPSIDLGESLRRIISTDGVGSSPSRSSSPAGTIGRGGWGNFARRRETTTESQAPSNAAMSPTLVSPSSPVAPGHSPQMPQLARSVSSSSVGGRSNLAPHILLGRKNSERSDSSKTPSSDGEHTAAGKRGLSRMLSKLGGGERRGAGRFLDDGNSPGATSGSERQASDEDGHSTNGSVSATVVPQALVDHFEASASKFDSFGRAVKAHEPRVRVPSVDDDDDGMIDITEFEYSESDDDDDDDDEEFDDFLKSPIDQTGGQFGGWSSAFDRLGIREEKQKDEPGLVAHVVPETMDDEETELEIHGHHHHHHCLPQHATYETPALEDSTPRPSTCTALGAELEQQQQQYWHQYQHEPTSLGSPSPEASLTSTLKACGGLSPESNGLTPTVSPRDGSIRASSMEPPSVGRREQSLWQQDDDDDDDAGIIIAPRRRRAATTSGGTPARA
ncbi:hypothetical protein OIO90_000547 [Microbotryomycetes sp. JL221]|nr:hypothetical protein OIO90_000547 [Microbotryomycetes sp. JL221]